MTWFQNMTTGHITSSPSGNVESLKLKRLATKSFYADITDAIRAKRKLEKQKLHDSVYPSMK
jgi:hypothetical protein